MLAKLSLRNIRRSVKDYAIYFCTLVLGVAIFYVFNALDSQSVMLMQISPEIQRIFELMTNVLGVISIFVAVVLGFLIIFASRFLMKRRKKEFGIYLTLGMGKAQISRILLIENLLIGVFALAAGILVGVFASQLMSIFVANLFEVNMTKFAFVFSTEAFFKTLILFGIIYLIVMIFSTISIARTKLINLLNAEKVGEKVKMKNLALSLILLFVAIFMLGFAYSRVSSGFENLQGASIIFYTILGIIGTFLLFFGLSGLALRFVKKFKKSYFKNLNSFIFRETDSKINTTVISLSVISLLLFFTIVIFSSAMSLRGNLNEKAEQLLPADFVAIQYPTHESAEIPDENSAKNLDENSENSVNNQTNSQNISDENSKLSAKNSLEKFGVNVKKDFSNFAEISEYRSDEITYRTTIDEKILAEFAGQEYYEMMLNTPENLVKESEYNSLAKLYKNAEIHLSANEFAVVGNYEMMVKVRDAALKNSPKISLGGQTFSAKYDHVIDGFINLNAQKIDVGFIVLPDSAIENYENSNADFHAQNFFVGIYNAKTDAEKREIEKNILNEIDKDSARAESNLAIDTRIEILANSAGVGAMATFVGLYLGIVFLIASAAILGLKEISESSDNTEKYSTLKKLGADEKMLKKTLLAQIAIFFSLPLFVAIIHSIFGIIFAQNILKTFANIDILPSIILTAVFVVAIYGGYFLVTYFTARRIAISK